MPMCPPRTRSRTSLRRPGSIRKQTVAAERVARYALDASSAGTRSYGERRDSQWGIRGRGVVDWHVAITERPVAPTARCGRDAIGTDRHGPVVGGEFAWVELVARPD